ncbi:hypothetical protein PTTG_04935 [Puccinia triticina 1-1 BBBD Race 1]|uniref:Uncharacterized protein n=1 Tax=Puccinia triticina (isolate 1-1 / race 1 (BBBD)) TaxID=630390 RepID=A0A0C4EVU9_PUCT1|nr:hypothetical protein PTTG_04935 [Puccinia triticina 1-1 BBBD Race 1]
MSSPIRNTHSPEPTTNPWGLPAAFSSNVQNANQNRRFSSQSRPASRANQTAPTGNRPPAPEDDGDVPVYTANEVNRFLEEASVQSLYHGRSPGQIVSHATSRLTAKDKLSPSSSNFAGWDLIMRELAREVFGNGAWFSMACTDPVQEQIGRSLLLATVDSSMHRSMLRHNNCFDIVTHLRSRFHTASRAKQMMIWEKLKNIKMSDFSSSSEAIAQILKLLDNFHSLGLDLDRESVGGLVLQASLETGSDLRREVD